MIEPVRQGVRVVGRDDERGVTLVLVALLIVALLLMVAIVIDLGALRQDRQADRSAADAAVAVGARQLGVAGGTPITACSAAWSSLLRSFNATGPSSPCSSLPATCAGTATVSTPPTTIGNAVVTISSPVANTDPMMKAETPGGDITQTYDASHDGTDPCSRIGVNIVYTRTPFLGQVAGINSWSTSIHAVALATADQIPGSDKPALVALNRTICNAINAGTGEIRVQGASPGLSGIIRSDTDATGSPSDCFAMNVKGGSGGSSSGALWTCLYSVIPLTCDGTGGLLRHYAPVGRALDSGSYTRIKGTLQQVLQRFTREPIDRVYHCSLVTTPNPCVLDGATIPDHMQSLETRLQSGGLPGYTTIAGADCSPALSKLYTELKYYVNCDTYTVKGTTVTFENPTEVVFKGGVSIESNGAFNVNTGLLGAVAGNSTTLYLRNGGLTKVATSAVTMLNTFMRSSGSLTFSGSGGSGTDGLVTWTPPVSGAFKSLIY